MKHTFLFAGYYAAIAAAHTNAGLRGIDSTTILQARYSNDQSGLLPRSERQQLHFKRSARGGESVAQDLGKGNKQWQKPTGQRSNQPTGQRQYKEGTQPSGQGRGKATGQQESQQTGRGTDPRTSKKGPGPKSPPIEDAVARVDMKGPGRMHKSEFLDFHPESVEAGHSGQLEATHPEQAVAGGITNLPPPPNAASQPQHQHPLKVEGHGGLVNARFNVPPGGLATAKFSMPGRGERITVEGGARGKMREKYMGPSVPEHARVEASGTHGSYIQVTAQNHAEGPPPKFDVPNLTREFEQARDQEFERMRPEGPN